MKRKTLSVLLLALVLGLALAGAAFDNAALAQSKSLYWQRYDVDVAIQKSGDFRVQETQELVFTSGSFSFGQREINKVELNDINDVTVSEAGGRQYTESSSGAPYTFSVRDTGSQVLIRYNFPPSSNSRRTIVIGYTVTGALRYYPQNGVDQLYWRAVTVPSGLRVQSSTITIHAPEDATFTNYGIYGAQGSADFQQGQKDATITVDQTLSAGDEVSVVAEWPHGIVAGAPQPWQQQVDTQAAQQQQQQEVQQRWGPVLTLTFGGLGVLFLVGGPVLLYMWWYRQGRDHPVGMIADYLPEPPEDLPAGMVGTLVDESADMQDILASILDLARRGAIEIQEVEEKGILGIGSHRDFIYRLKDASIATRQYEQTLIREIFGTRDEVRLSDLKNEFYTAIPTLRKQLYDAVVSEGFFKESPETTRNRVGCMGVVVLVLAGGLAFALLALGGNITGAAVCPGLGLAATAIGIFVLSRYMPRRTDKGADANARWLAFKRYIQNLEKYTKVEDAASIFDKYLPYAVAFGLERTWMQKFASVNAPAPTWWIPVGVPYPGYYGPGWFGGGMGQGGGSGPRDVGGGTIGGSERPAPNLGDMSRGMGSSLAGMSAGLGAMLNSASRTLTSTPQPTRSGGGFGGGGFGGGGFSGGGGFGGGGSGGGGSSFG